MQDFKRVRHTSRCLQGQLREAIRDMVLRCTQTLFIFDEAEKLHSGLINAIKPYMDHYDNVDGVNYRGAIFLFLRSVESKNEKPCSDCVDIVTFWNSMNWLSSCCTEGYRSWPCLGWPANIWQLIHPAIYSTKCWHGVRWARCLYSNIGGVTINDVALDFWHSGQNREDIGMEDLEHRLRAETMESQGVFYDQPVFGIFTLLSLPHTLILPSRRLCSEWPDVRPLDRLLRAVPAPWVPPRQTVRPWRLCSPRPGGGWGDPGRGGQGDAVRPQRGEAVLRPGMQIDTTTDQLLSAIEKRRCDQREVWNCCSSPTVYIWHSGDVLPAFTGAQKYRVRVSHFERPSGCRIW